MGFEMIVLGIHGGVTLGQHEPGAALCVDGTIEVARVKKNVI